MSTEENKPGETPEVADTANETPANGADNVSELKPNRETELMNELLYQRAEFENFRKRILREQESSIKYANEKLVRDLLTVVDLFDRAMQSASTLGSDASSFVTGIEMTRKELTQTLTRNGVEFVGSKNEAFDPQRHEAISEFETESSDEVGKVVQVAQKGCVLSGRLLKPAQVVVGKAKS